MSALIYQFYDENGTHMFNLLSMGGESTEQIESLVGARMQLYRIEQQGRGIAVLIDQPSYYEYTYLNTWPIPPQNYKSKG